MWLFTVGPQESLREEEGEPAKGPSQETTGSHSSPAIALTHGEQDLHLLPLFLFAYSFPNHPHPIDKQIG